MEDVNPARENMTSVSAPEDSTTSPSRITPPGHLQRLPTELILEIYEYLPNYRDLDALSRTCLKLYHIIHPNLKRWWDENGHFCCRQRWPSFRCSQNGFSFVIGILEVNGAIGALSAVDWALKQPRLAALVKYIRFEPGLISRPGEILHGLAVGRFGLDAPWPEWVHPEEQWSDSQIQKFRRMVIDAPQSIREIYKSSPQIRGIWRTPGVQNYAGGSQIADLKYLRHNLRDDMMEYVFYMLMPRTFPNMRKLELAAPVFDGPQKDMRQRLETQWSLLVGVILSNPYFLTQLKHLDASGPSYSPGDLEVLRDTWRNRNLSVVKFFDIGVYRVRINWLGEIYTRLPSAGDHDSTKFTALVMCSNYSTKELSVDQSSPKRFHVTMSRSPQGLSLLQAHENDMSFLGDVCTTIRNPMYITLTTLIMDSQMMNLDALSIGFGKAPRIISRTIRRLKLYDKDRKYQVHDLGKTVGSLDSLWYLAHISIQLGHLLGVYHSHPDEMALHLPRDSALLSGQELRSFGGQRMPTSATYLLTQLLPRSLRVLTLFKEATYTDGEEPYTQADMRHMAATYLAVMSILRAKIKRFPHLATIRLCRELGDRTEESDGSSRWRGYQEVRDLQEQTCRLAKVLRVELVFEDVSVETEFA